MSNDRLDPANDAGFGFLELIISLVLLSLLSLTLTWSLRIGIQTWDKVTKDQDAQADVYFAQNALRLFLSSARVDPNAQGTMPLKFEGAADNLVLIARMPEQFGYGGDYQVAIKARRREGGQTDLVILPSVYDPRTGERATPNRSETVLLSNIKALVFRYLGAPTEIQSPEWSLGWNDRTKLPVLISLDITFPDGSNRFWPTLLVAPRISGALVP
ncbi:hypothetical protein HYPP_03218 [Hyphomicrobium sp. ghe19]|nr:hypothetical protein HYPP_03218 [Hyphomicrobium sp. ghe19]